MQLNVKMAGYAKDVRLITDVQGQFKKSEIKIETQEGNVPSILVQIPDKWPYIKLAPWYDVHIGANNHEKFMHDLEWFENEPYTIGWLGGDIIENASKLSIGSGVYEQDYKADNQLAVAIKMFARVKHKLLFSIPGNHEDRTNIVGVDLACWGARMLDIPYSPDFMFVTFLWRGNKIRLLAHHGAGGAATPGAQRMSLRRMTNIADADLYWMGHLHSELVDKIVKVGFVGTNTKNAPEIRESLGIISPSYVPYFKTYAAKKILSPTSQGLTVVTIQPDGRLDASVHANGKRL
jgi:hypothetical protein